MKKMPFFAYVVESEEGEFLGYSIHVHGVFHNFPADPTTASFESTPVERCIFKTEKRIGMPNIATMDSLMGTLENIVSGLRVSGASSHEVNGLYANLKVSKSHLKDEKLRGMNVQVALRYIEEASEFIAAYRHSEDEQPRR